MSFLAEERRIECSNERLLHQLFVQGRKERFIVQVLYECCCGLDVHKKSITACTMISEGKDQIFGTMTDDSLQLAYWLKQKNVTHVAMESTGVYWKSVYPLKYLVVNAQYIKTVPVRKTDIKNAEWIAELLRHGLIKARHIPNREQRELRELIHYRRSHIEERARELNRMQKVLEEANIKLSLVVCDINGASGNDSSADRWNGSSDSFCLH
ncbi:IS110 family transposase [Aeribacillus sp. FSL K6-2848]|uniref:IS110 family transposase n=1 Tax=Aeribacillus sp. FSL K6-2848 TaxID=2954612 RepID=UPI0030F8838F